MTLRWVPGWNGLTEPEAVSYVAAVEAADGQELEFGVAKAINDFVLGCKNDGIWPAIKASCILAGARTLDGALVPLVGTAPTNVNFVEDDYNRETGLVGNGSTKYLNSNRLLSADPANSVHNAAWVTTIGNMYPIIAHDTWVTTGSTGIGYGGSRNRSNISNAITAVPGINATSRNTSSAFSWRHGSSSGSTTAASELPPNENYWIFREGTYYGSHRLSFYSIGESLDLEKLDNRVTRLMNLITYTQTAGLPDLATMDIDAAAYIGGGYRVGGTLS